MGFKVEKRKADLGSVLKGNSLEWSLHTNGKRDCSCSAQSVAKGWKGEKRWKGPNEGGG